MCAFDWLKPTARPMPPSTGASANWLSASIDCPSAATGGSSSLSARGAAGCENAVDVHDPGGHPQHDEQQEEPRLGAEPAIEQPPDQQTHHQGRDQLDPHPESDPPG